MSGSQPAREPEDSKRPVGVGDTSTAIPPVGPAQWMKTMSNPRPANPAIPRDLKAANTAVLDLLRCLAQGIHPAISALSGPPDAPPQIPCAMEQIAKIVDQLPPLIEECDAKLFEVRDELDTAHGSIPSLHEQVVDRARDFLDRARDLCSSSVTVVEAVTLASGGNLEAGKLSCPNVPPEATPVAPETTVLHNWLAIERFHFHPLGFNLDPAPGWEEGWISKLDPEIQQVIRRRARKPSRKEEVGEYRLIRSGVMWEIRGCEESGILPNLKGMANLVQLLRNPGECVPWGKLLDFSPAVVDPHSKQPAVTQEAHLAFQNEVQRLQNEIDEADNPVDKEDSQRALDLLLEKAKSGYGIGGKPRDLNDQTAKFRSRVYDRLNNIYTKMRKGTPALIQLAAHFTAHIHATETGYSYTPPAPAPKWQLDAEGK